VGPGRREREQLTPNRALLRQNERVTASTEPQTPRRVDGSMSLLVDMMTNTLDESYAEAARRRTGAVTSPAAGSSGRPSARRRVVAVLLLVALGAVTGIAAAQVKRREASLGGVRPQLVADVQRRTGETDALAAQTAQLREEVARRQDAGLSAGAAGRDAARQLAALELAAGVGAVTGPGVVLRLDDAPAASPQDPGEAAVRGGAINEGRVLDRDLQDAVNGLWAAGAEAISVNGLRLTTQTAIRSAGEAILVDYRPLSPPYVVRAIGNPQVLQPSFVDGAAGRRLATYTSLYGLQLQVERTDAQTLSGSGSPSLRLARPDGGPS